MIKSAQIEDLHKRRLSFYHGHHQAPDPLDDQERVFFSWSFSTSICARSKTAMCATCCAETRCGQRRWPPRGPPSWPHCKGWPMSKTVTWPSTRGPMSMRPGRKSRKKTAVWAEFIVTVTAADRHINVEVDTEYMNDLAELDGCYALKPTCRFTGGGQRAGP
jgi:hypothetical protein